MRACPKTGSGVEGVREKGRGPRVEGSRTEETERERVSRVKEPVKGAERVRRVEERMVEEGKSK